MFNLESKTPKILVIGDLMIDHYVWGQCERISPEAPVQVVDVKSESNRLGGACNVVSNLAALNAQVFVCGVIGSDDAGLWLGDKLESMGVDISYLFVDTARPTTKKTRIIISNQQVLRVDRESKMPVDSEIIDDIKQRLQAAINEVDCVIISDYGKGLLSVDLTQYIIKHAKSCSKIILCDPKGKDYSKYKGATLLTPNKKEAQEATGIDIVDEHTLIEAGMAIKMQCELEISLITLSEDGIGLFENHTMRQIPTVAKEVFDVTGAGDTVIAALGFALSGGCDILQACEFANVAAAVVVGKVGSASATHSEILQYHTQYFSCNESKFVSQEMLLHILQGLKQSKVVFTNGCFDILHRGHLTYLAKARSLGDVLIVGINSDDSVMRLKGENRPINSLEDRAYMLCGLECVDYVVSFSSDTPLELIKAIKPDVLVKGGDYHNKVVVGSEFAKEVVLIDFVEGKSTTKIIHKIQQRGE
ncbi:D-glycero-beta-D-manno-heptose-7-phosphate kinase [Helicobacter sp. MIT 05-5293]|uniref:D-glycero-beta-D-manno-heptose-7-phosphate kinase n=1 Tax=Helicobacter sp. MIT 05-5293 TaxID=1548149 RepID=UPI00051E0CD0|nr:D-glycero-beta-D-manno-heptose-7-phosphate kinase [Helicobacter sp. MIT 05-5293]TLD81661.1 D-glycero-beta-D-manno-heptose-7-phosphate kinase [Helicobacter sp. MIT 05-5293]